MRIATWNVNSVRARLPVLLDWLARERPDIACLQEIKCLDDVFPREALEEAGYQAVTYGQKTYNGVAILSKKRIEDVGRGMLDDVEDAEARVISAVVEDVIVLNAYVVNGQEVGHPRYDYKLKWLERLASSIARRFDVGKEKVIVCGDFNVTFDDRDVYDPEAWREKILCSTKERAALKLVTDVGLTDAFRKFHEEPGHHTWWDFRTRGFQRKQGLRIDHHLLSPAAMQACTGVEIDLAPRAGEKPSDHAPVIATLG
jgi:exodeoxyribonuclease-3